MARSIAGTGTCGYSGDGGSSKEAEIEIPRQVAVGGGGDIFVASGYTIRRIDHSSRTIEVFAGRNGNTCLTGGGPYLEVGMRATVGGIWVIGMAYDPNSGHLFVANRCGRSIVEIDEESTIVGVYGGSYPDWTQGALAVGPEGDVYYTAGFYGQAVRKLDAFTHRSTAYAGNESGGIGGNGGPATLAELDEVHGLAVDSNGTLFISTDTGLLHYVRRVDSEGTMLALSGLTWASHQLRPPGTPASQAGYASADLLAVDDEDNLYLSDAQDRTLFAIQGPAQPSSLTAVLMQDHVQVLDFDRRGGGNPSENDCDQACVGDPVSTASGEYSETASDVAIPGRGPALDFSRTYSSLSADAGGPLGDGWVGDCFMSLGVDEAGLVTITQENGSQIVFEPDGRGGYVGADAYLATLVLNEDESFTLTRRQRERFHFDPEGRLIDVSDLNGETTTLAYEEGGALETVTSASGATLTLAYDAEGRVRQVRDSAGRTVRYGYTGDDLTSVVDVRGETWRYAYDEHHFLTRRTDPNGHVDIENEYDAEGRVTAQTDGNRGVTHYDYRPGVTQITSPERRVRLDYYASGELVRRIDGAGTAQEASWSYEYDPDTHGTTKTTDPDGHVWRAAYDAEGRQTSTTDPLEHTTHTTYDELGDVLTFEDPEHVRTRSRYDESGNLLSVSTPLVGSGEERVVRYVHGDERHPGDVTSIVDPRGKTTSFEYDAAGNRTSITDPLGDETTMTYDAAGQLETSVSPRGNVEGGRPEQHTTRYVHDAAGALTQQTDPLGHVTRSTFDPAGNLESTTDPERRTTTYGYDDADQLTTVVRPDRTTLRTAYDGDGNRTATTDGASATTRYTFDALGRLSGVTDPLRRLTTFDYDANGNLTSRVDAAERTTSYAYDDANQLRTIGYSDRTTPNVTYGYDAAGRRTSMRDGSGTTRFTFDSLARLTQQQDGNGTTVEYAYDLAGNLRTLTYPAGTVTRAYDDAGRLETVTDWLRATTRFAYDADSELLRTTFPSGTSNVDTYAWDDAGMQRSATFKQGASTLASLEYARDGSGMPTQIEQSGLPGSATSRSTYTALAQLERSDGSSYEYDGADNVAKLAGAEPLTYDAANELREGPVAPGRAGTPASFAYDPDGNRTSATPEGGSATRYAYDQADRLTGFTPPTGPRATYAYDGDGLRTAKTVGEAVTEHFVWDQSAGLPLLLSDANASYIYGPDGTPIEQIDTRGTPTYYHHDDIGSTRMLTDSSGEPTATFTYAPFGTPTGSTGTQTTPLGFAGEYTDTESGLQYLRARYLDPATGQFMSRDPLEATTGEPYAYADNTPLAATDPTGMLGWSDIAGAGMVISNAAAGALNEITFGLSNTIVGVDGSCAGKGYGFGSKGGFLASLFGGGEIRLGLDAERMAGRELIRGEEHGAGVLGFDLNKHNYVNRANPRTSVHVDLHPKRHGGPHYDIHNRATRNKTQWPLDEPIRLP